MSISADIQIASSSKDIPSDSDIEDWICHTLRYVSRDSADLTVRVVDEEEITYLNHTYRLKNAPTDVLAFTNNLPDEIDLDLLGDVVVCADVINRQAVECNASCEAHWARIIAHGILHLCGFDHELPQDAIKMKTAEASILKDIGLSHPDLAG